MTPLEAAPRMAETPSFAQLEALEILASRPIPPSDPVFRSRGKSILALVRKGFAELREGSKAKPGPLAYYITDEGARALFSRPGPQ